MNEIAQAIVLVAGIGLLVFACSWIQRETPTGKIFVLLLFPTGLILSAMWSPRVRHFDLGKDGVKIDLDTQKQAAEKAVESYPALAEQIVKSQGPKATHTALELIQNAKSEEDLKKIVPYEIRRNAIYFYGKGFGEGGFGQGGFGGGEPQQVIYPVSVDSGSPKAEKPLLLQAAPDHTYTRQKDFTRQ